MVRHQKNKKKHENTTIKPFVFSYRHVSEFRRHLKHKITWASPSRWSQHPMIWMKYHAKSCEYVYSIPRSSFVALIFLGEVVVFFLRYRWEKSSSWPKRLFLQFTYDFSGFILCFITCYTFNMIQSYFSWLFENGPVRKLNDATMT